MDKLPRTPFVLRFGEAAPLRGVTSGSYDRERQVWVAPAGEGLAYGNTPTTLNTSAPERTDEIDQGEGV
jgi:hypothetical protein